VLHKLKSDEDTRANGRVRTKARTIIALRVGVFFLAPGSCPVFPAYPLIRWMSDVFRQFQPLNTAGLTRL
jgi:hypothetical protein